MRDHFDSNEQDYVAVADAPARNTGAIKLHGADAFEGMRRAGRLAAEVLDMITEHVAPGVTTAERPIRCMQSSRIHGN